MFLNSKAIRLLEEAVVFGKEIPIPLSDAKKVYKKLNKSINNIETTINRSQSPVTHPFGQGKNSNIQTFSFNPKLNIENNDNWKENMSLKSSPVHVLNIGNEFKIMKPNSDEAGVYQTSFTNLNNNKDYYLNVPHKILSTTLATKDQKCEIGSPGCVYKTGGNLNIDLETDNYDEYKKNRDIIPDYINKMINRIIDKSNIDKIPLIKVDMTAQNNSLSKFLTKDINEFNLKNEYNFKNSNLGQYLKLIKNNVPNFKFSFNAAIESLNRLNKNFDSQNLSKFNDYLKNN